MISPRYFLAIVFVLVCTTAFAHHPQSVQGMINGFLYTFTDQGLTFRSLDSDKEELSIRWNSSQVAHDVYMMDEMGMTQGLDIQNDAEMIWHDKKVLIENIYSNIDLVIHPGNLEADQLIFEFVVYPGGNPQDIQLESAVLNAVQENVNQDAVIPVSIQAHQDLGSEMTDLFVDMVIQPQKKLVLSVPTYDQANILSMQVALQVQSESAEYVQN
ncbi:MAG: hypothetical protein AAF135_12460 [Bacteroidota bacterium]